MTSSSIFDYFNLLKKDKLSFIYQGSFNSEITNKIIDLSSNLVPDSKTPGNFINKVSFLMAECFQNIVRHEHKITSDFGLDLPSGMFLSRQNKSSFIISSANLIQKIQIDQLKYTIDNLNKLTTDELNALYLDVLGNSIISEKGGAGLGLIEMARKSKQKLDYYFESIDDYHALFYLQIKIKLTNTISPSRQGVAFLKESVKLHSRITSEKVLMIHKGDFSNEAVVPILKMIENNMPDQIQSHQNRKRIYHMVVEIMQNVSKHALTIKGYKEGVFVLARDNGTHSISTGNYILNSNRIKLQHYLEDLSTLERSEIDSQYKEVLHSENYNSGLGLLDIFRESCKEVKYQFYDIDDKKSFFIFSAFI